MKIEIKQLSDLHPADYNPRKDIQPGDPEYEKLKRSIQEFGYVEPIIWNAKTGHVIGGHQRLKILQEQGLNEAECVVVDFDEAKEKALNVALNKITNKWDLDKLSDLLEDINTSGLDLELTGFSAGDIAKLNSRNDLDFDGYYGDAREATYNYYRLHEYDETRTAGYYQFPTIKACHVIPDDLLEFNYARSYRGDKSKVGIHFFLDDYQFARIWNRPYENIEILRDYQCVIMPDFSLYDDMPKAMKIWNLYRIRLTGQIMQDAGLKVIPNIREIGDSEDEIKQSYEGIEPGGVVAISVRGLFGRNGGEDLLNSTKQMTDAMIRILKPECVICYGGKIPDYEFTGTKVVYIKSFTFKK